MNPLSEVPAFAIRNLTHQGLRSYLTLLGVIIGIAAIVTLFSLGSGLNNAAREQFEQLGSNTLFVGLSGEFTQASGSSTNIKTLSESTINKIKAISQVEVVLAPVTAPVSIEYGRETVSGVVIATTPEESDAFADTGFVEVAEGRGLENRDVFSAFIGYSLAKDTFETEVRVGSKIDIEGKSFKVIGITQQSAQSFGGGPNTNNTIFISKRGYSQLFEETDPIFLLVKTNDPEDIGIVKDKIERIFESVYGKDQKVYEVVTSDQLLEQIGQFLGIIQLVLVGIASISLLVGGIGIMNTMIMSVLERTAEIGVMKAVGATNTLVLGVFLAEAAFIGLVGGFFGVVVGYLLAFLVGAISVTTGLALKVELDVGLIIGSLLFAMIVGMISGYIPARRAAKMDPVVALRGIE
ncbi:MAG: ABC transporter permease [archaeon]